MERGEGEGAGTETGLRCGPLLAAVALFSMVANLLMLTGPLYMLQVHDRVLASGSEATLAALTVLALYLYLCMALLDHARGRLLGRIALRLRAALDGPVFAAVLRRAALRPGPQAGGLRDLDMVQRLVAAPVVPALFDLPWTPLFLGVIFLFHPALGALALAGAAALVALCLLTQALTRRAARAAAAASEAAERLADQLREEAEAVAALGMGGAGFARWQRLRAGAVRAGLTQADRAGAAAAASRALRLLLQSLMLGLGALLVLRGELTAGAMVAAAILLGRALAPVEQVIAQWDLVQAGWAAWRAVRATLAEVPEDGRRTALPRPEARLEVQGLTVLPPGARAPALRGLAVALGPGQALAVIGPSGAGKSTLARTLAGVLPPAAGEIRLGGAGLGQYGRDGLGRLIGYLPQRVMLFDGTLAENIARLDPAPPDAAVVEAARRAGVHGAILRLPAGYDTRVTAEGSPLSGGAVRRIGLARALYGDPVLLILDEPDASLDAEGTEALASAIRAHKARGGAAVVVAHRPASIRDCDLVLVLEAGTRRAFGPRETVLRETLGTAPLRRAAPGGGG